MDTRKLLIADGSEEFRTAAAQVFQKHYHVRVCGDGPETLSVLRSFRPDLLILDLMMPGLDGISLLYAGLEEGICPVVLATCRFMSEYISDAAEKLKISYVMIKPCNLQAMADRVQDLTQRIQQPLVTRPDSRSSVSNILISLGLRTNFRGYTFLREAILQMAKNPDQTITKELYPSVADLCNANALQVERAIRSAIKHGWENRDDRVWQQYFPPGPDGTVPRPTNAQFICRLADQLVLQQNSSY